MVFNEKFDNRRSRTADLVTSRGKTNSRSLEFRGSQGRRVFAGFLPLMVVLFIAGVVHGATAPERSVPTSGSVEHTVTRVVAKALPQTHYTRQPLDDDVSRKVFDEYLAALDNNRSYFLQSDIDHFAGYRLILDDELKAGNLDFAFDVFETLVQRVEERVEFVRSVLAEPFDFTLDIEYTHDRSEQPWFQDPEARDRIWRLRVKNEVLSRKIEEIVKNEARDKKATEKKNEVVPGETGGKKAAADDSLGEGPSGNDQDETRAGMVPETPKESIAENSDGQIAEESEKEKDPEEIARERVQKTYDKIVTRLKENDNIDVLELFLSALSRVYDPHSAYMAPATKENFDISMKLKLQGIGARLTTVDGYVTVVEVIAGGPADKDGRLKIDDRIIAVAQEGGEPIDVINLPLRKVVTKIRGTKGTRVYLTVIEAEKALDSKPVVIDIVRDVIKLTDKGAKIKYYPIPDMTSAGSNGLQQVEDAVPPDDDELGKPESSDDDEAVVEEQSSVDDEAETGERSQEKLAAVVKFSSFYFDYEGKQRGKKDYRSTTKDIKRLISEATEKGIAGLIIDLRSNRGGSMDEAISLAGLFFPQGPVLQIKYAGGQKKVRSDPDPGMHYDGPLVILVDRYSASSSEICAAAIQDYGRGIIVGEKATYGKGTVQTVHALYKMAQPRSIFKGKKPGSLKSTTAKFYRVNGGSTQHKGVIPDLIVPSFRDHRTIGEAELDNALPWDQIESLNAQGTVDIRRHLPELESRFAERMKDDHQQSMLADIEEFGIRQKEKARSLNLVKRMERAKEDRDWSSRIKKYDRQSHSKNKKSPKDRLLDEAMMVLADLIEIEDNNYTHGPGAAPADPITP